MVSRVSASMKAIILTTRKAASSLGRTSSRHGSGLPHLAAATHQRHDSGLRPRRKYLDYHPIDRECGITFTVSV